MPSPAGHWSKAPLSGVRGRLVWLRDDPFLVDPAAALAHESDGLLLFQDGHIVEAGGFAELAEQIPAGTPIDHYPGELILPGFIDTHVHYPQTGIVGASGHRLLDWLEHSAFPAERAFADPAHARMVAKLFCDELLRNGTTSALVFTTVHPHATDALFEEALSRSMRLIAGKVMMDRNAPAALLDTAQTSYTDSQALIGRWHGRDRLLYAITPRFAATSTPAQLEAAGALWREHPGTFVHSHIAENIDEGAWVSRLFPDRAGYLDIYDHYGLVGRRAMFAHGIHLTEAELGRCHDSGAALAHCPTSNLFLGSGLLHVHHVKARHRPVHVGLGTDIGAGTSFSMLATAGEAYKVAQLAGAALTPVEALFLATLGGARALGVEDHIGSFAPGLEADFTIVDPAATPLLAFRSARVESIEELLSVLMALGDDRAIHATYVAGRRAHERTS